jgi:hypothetical protein
MVYANGFNSRLDLNTNQYLWSIHIWYNVFGISYLFSSHQLLLPFLNCVYEASWFKDSKPASIFCYRVIILECLPFSKSLWILNSAMEAWNKSWLIFLHLILGFGDNIVRVFHGNLPHVANSDNRSAKTLARRLGPVSTLSPNSAVRVFAWHVL